MWHLSVSRNISSYLFCSQLAIDRTNNRILIKAGHVLFIVNDDSSLRPLSYIFVFYLMHIHFFLFIFFFLLFIRIFLCKLSTQYTRPWETDLSCVSHTIDGWMNCDVMRCDSMDYSKNNNDKKTKAKHKQ